MTGQPKRPSKAELEAAKNGSVEDVIAPGLRVLFTGINPGLYTAAIGHHFGRPGNRFWPALYHSGFTPRLLSPYEEQELLQYGCGITNLVNRATATAEELSRDELEAGGRRLETSAARYHPHTIAVLGVGAYRSAFRRPKAALGIQPEQIEGSRLWVLPNPSGLNAHYQLNDLAALFRELCESLKMEE